MLISGRVRPGPEPLPWSWLWWPWLVGASGTRLAPGHRMLLAMRRLFVLLLLAFLPLQSVWAVAASYCMHEAVPAAAHFGHHVHAHHEGHEGHADGAGASAAKAGADMDCHACHGMGNALHMDAVAPPLRLAGTRPAPFVLPLLQSPSPHRPERPNWRVLA